MTKLKLFVATSRGQGMRTNDFCHTVEGEILTYPVECANDDNPDGRCGCRRSMAGIASHRATTTFTVAELEMTIADLAQLLADDLNAQVAEFIGPVDIAEVMEDARDLADDASHFRVGAILEKRGDIVQVRGISQAA